ITLQTRYLIGGQPLELSGSQRLNLFRCHFVMLMASEYEDLTRLECRNVPFRSSSQIIRFDSGDLTGRESLDLTGGQYLHLIRSRSEERRVGKECSFIGAPPKYNFSVERDKMVGDKAVQLCV